MNHSLTHEQALLLPAREAATLCGVSERTWHSWDAGARVPQAVEIGRSKFWRREGTGTMDSAGLSGPPGSGRAISMGEQFVIV